MTKTYFGNEFTRMDCTLENDTFKCNVTQDIVDDDWNVVGTQQIGFLFTEDRENARRFVRRYIREFNMKSTESLAYEYHMSRTLEGMGMTI